MVPVVLLLRLFVVVLSLAGRCFSLALDVTDPESIRGTAATIAFSMMKYYHNNASDTAPDKVGLLDFKPYYWWQSGALWDKGAMVDYWAYTKDDSYVATTIQGLMSQVGPNLDYIVPVHRRDEGNDDQAFWGMALLSAIETGFPSPPASQPQYRPLIKALFANQVSRWDTATCNGGMKWQIYPENAYGYWYKNAISNGATFQLAARLARLTGDQQYIDWADKIWDWSVNAGLINSVYDVYDGVDEKDNCANTSLHKMQWSYNVGVYLHGAAALAQHTGDSKWRTRLNGLLDSISAVFTTRSDALGLNHVLYEPACEPQASCNTDQLSFKGFVARWLGKAALLIPDIGPQVREILEDSARAAAQSCDETRGCAMKWTVGGWDGSNRPDRAGQQMSALETVQALLAWRAGSWLWRRHDEMDHDKGSTVTTTATEEKTASSADTKITDTKITATKTTPEPTSTTATETGLQTDTSALSTAEFTSTTKSMPSAARPKGGLVSYTPVPHDAASTESLAGLTLLTGLAMAICFVMV